MKLIAIETSTDICSISYFVDGKCENIIEKKIPRQHAEQLPLFYNELVDETYLKLNDIDAIGVSIGPGSFTGLRIGLSYAKGLAYSHKKPIIPVPTMLSLLHGSGKTSGKIVVIMLSHGNKYFFQKYEYTDIELTSEKVQILEITNINDIKESIIDNTIVQYGCNNLLNNTRINTHCVEIKPSSKWIGELAHHNYESWIVQKPYNLVPDYISPFKIGK